MDIHHLKVNLVNKAIEQAVIKIKNSRKHNIINIVNKIVKEHDIIVSEKLNSSNHKLAKNILDGGFNKICENCGNTNDRDINASINIMFEGVKMHYAR